MAPPHYHYHCSANGETALAALASISGLPKLRIKDAMAKGAVWLGRGGKTKRLRRATLALQPGDTLDLYYDPAVLALTPPEPTLLADERAWTVWVKPAGLLAQGSRSGDHCALLRLAEQRLQRDSYLVHRLDREAAGLMLLAHTGKAAAAFSALFANARKAGIEKGYRVEVAGALDAANGTIEQPLDGKDALTHYTRQAYRAERDSSLAEVMLVTGRKHQIRRHFAALGHPVLGDPRYGREHPDPRGLQLFAVRLAFTCPLKRKRFEFQWEPNPEQQ